MRRMLFTFPLLLASSAWAAEPAKLTDKEISTLQRDYEQAAYMCNDNYGNPALSGWCGAAEYSKQKLRTVGICASFMGWAFFTSCAPSKEE